MDRRQATARLGGLPGSGPLGFTGKWRIAEALSACSNAGKTPDRYGKWGWWLDLGLGQVRQVLICP